MSNAQIKEPKEPLESHGLRLLPQSWRKVERLARRKETDRSDWLRTKIEAVLELEPDLHDMDDDDHAEHADSATKTGGAW